VANDYLEQYGRVAAAKPVVTASGASRAELQELEAVWRGLFKRHFPEIPLATHWDGRERGQASNLLKLYKLSEVRDAFIYWLLFWDSNRVRFLKKSALLPTVGQVLFLHITVVPEAKLVLAAQESQTAYWVELDKGATVTPEMQLRYDQACELLGSLGIFKKTAKWSAFRGMVERIGGVEAATTLLKCKPGTVKQWLDGAHDIPQGVMTELRLSAELKTTG
jgi:hypothetical protein